MEDKKLPYERNHHLEQLLCCFVVVGDGQADAIVELFNANEAYISLITRGKGTAGRDLYEILGVANYKKNIVVSIIRENRWKVVAKQLRERFSISRLSKGIAFCVKIDAVMCVSIYKMLANVRYIDKPIKKFAVRHKKEEDK